MLACTEDRFGAVARTGAPYVGSCGALDMVHFGAMDTVPDRYRGRKFYPHNPQVTLMHHRGRERAAGRVDRRQAEPLHGRCVS